MVAPFQSGPLQPPAAFLECLYAGYLSVIEAGAPDGGKTSSAYMHELLFVSEKENANQKARWTVPADRPGRQTRQEGTDKRYQ